MLYERQSLPELHYIKHLHDSDEQGVKYVKYDDVIFEKTLSPYIFNNSTMNSWLIKLQPLVSIFFDQFNVIKNLKNYIVDKYEYRQL